MSLARVGGTIPWAKPKHSIDTITDAWIGWQTTPNSVLAWGTQYRAIYVPIRVASRVTVVQLGISVAATATGNIDLGIYYPNGTRIVSTGSTTKLAASGVQVVDITDTVLVPGLYYLGANNSTTGDTFNCASITAPLLASWGVLTETLGSVTLPATASWAVDNSLTVYPVISAMLNTVVT